MSIHGGYFTEYFIADDNYFVEVWDRGGEGIGRFRFSPLSFTIDENFLHFFPYRTMDEFIQSNYFDGIDFTTNVRGNRIEYIHFLGQGSRHILEFNNGLLQSIGIDWYMP